MAVFKEIFPELLKKRGVSTYKLTKETGISNGLINGWKKGNNLPSAENLIKLSDYFDVTVDFLLGRSPWEKFPDQIPESDGKQQTEMQTEIPKAEPELPDAMPSQEQRQKNREREFEIVKINNETLAGENTYLKTKLKKYKRRQQEQELSTVRSRDRAVRLYEDDYIELCFLGCEVVSGMEYVVLFARNKTQMRLTVQASALVFDGESLGRIFGSERLLPKTRGQLRFMAKNRFPTYDPAKVSGEMEIVDFSRELIEDQVGTFSFNDVETKSQDPKMII